MEHIKTGMIFPEKNAVSYTHLDVYKRQQFDLYMYEGSELEEQSNNENEGTGHVT